MARGLNDASIAPQQTRSVSERAARRDAVCCSRPIPGMRHENDMEEDELDQSTVMSMADDAEQEKQRQESEPLDPMALLAYYRRLLPFKSLYTWLNRDITPTRHFTHREFALTLQNDAYLRYQSYSTWDEWKKEVCRMNPSRFEIGPVYSAKPKDRKTLQKASFRPVARELVFDIDMTDYDEIRTCCSDKSICHRCWKLIAVAAEVLDMTLREDFGFRHLVWVYSGRRGIHCWVSDQEAFQLADDARKALVGWIEVVKGGANQAKKVALGSSMPGHHRVLHPSLRRALGQDVLRSTASASSAATESHPRQGGSGLLQRAFVDVILRDQDCFRDPQRSDVLLALLPASETDAVARLQSKWASSARSSVQKWDDVLDMAARSAERVKPMWIAALEDIVLQYTYPRIDAEVSKRQNHLLKAPFVVHPSTGRVCVPLELDQVQMFDPHSSAPTIAQILQELNQESTNASSARGEWEKTSLRPFVEQFDRACTRMVRETQEAKRAAQRHSLDF